MMAAPMSAAMAMLGERRRRNGKRRSYRRHGQN
jgi:hypothetical protein